jgi:transcriptional regulator with XRE-family HTH domain
MSYDKPGKKQWYNMPRLNVKQIAEQKGFGVRQLSRASGVNHVTTIKYWHNRVQRLDMSVLKRLATALGVTINDLIADEEEEEHAC